MITEEFEKQYKSLNIAQKEAVDAIEGAVMVVAGPGTGKTKTLTLRIANILLKTQVNPENILALTFTEAAAYEMRKRLLGIIGHDAYRVEITTFHSFCNNFIKRHQEEFSHIISSENINEIDQLEIIADCIKKLPLIMLKPLGDLNHYIQPSLRAIGNLKQENISPEDFRIGLKKYEEDLKQKDDLYHDKGAHKGKMKSYYRKEFDNLKKNKELLAVYEAYQKSLFEQKKYDYNDMLLEVIEKLSTHEYLLQYLQEKFQYILVDEHQDTNASQNKIVELVSQYFDNPNLFIVGDEKQAIFRFQGATTANFFMFQEKYPEAKLINLSENYRSSKNILSSSYALISNNPKHSKVLAEDHPLKSNVNYPDKKVQVVALSSENAETLYVGEKIKELMKDTPAHEIVLLVRNNKDVEPYVAAFEKLQIPYMVQADNNILDDLDIQKLILILKTVYKQNNENVQRAILLDCFEVSPLDAFKINRTVFEKKLQVWDVLTSKDLLSELNLVDANKIENFVELIMSKKGLVAKSANERFDVTFLDALNKSNLLNTILKKNNGQEILGRITRLYDEVKKQVARNPLYGISDFIKFIELLETHKVSLKTNTSIVPENTVRIMTVHKSKGLEFDHVFIVGAIDGHWGNKHSPGSKFSIPWDHFSSIKAKDDIEDENADERRLFYVAMTRARKSIYITYSECSLDGREQAPSQFINEIPDEFIENVDLKEFEEMYGSKMEDILTNKELEKGRLVTADYAAELFRRQGLSVSALNNYLKCPWKFFFVNLLRLPERIDNSGLFGSAIHLALNQQVIRIKKGLPPSKEILLKSFDDEMKRLPFSEKEYERFLERGRGALSGFYNMHIVTWNKEMESELDIRGIRINDNLILNGKIDMIMPSGKESFDVTDFKTGKPKTRNVIEGKVKNGDGNYKRQLVFYKILLDRYRNGFFKMKSGIIEFVEPTERGDYKREVFEISRQEADLLLKQTAKVAEEIVTLSFWDKSCSDQECEYCRLRKFIG